MTVPAPVRVTVRTGDGGRSGDHRVGEGSGGVGGGCDREGERSIGLVGDREDDGRSAYANGEGSGLAGGSVVAVSCFGRLEDDGAGPGEGDGGAGDGSRSGDHRVGEGPGGVGGGADGKG